MPEILSVCCAWRRIIADAIVPHAANKNTVVHELKSYEKRGDGVVNIYIIAAFICLHVLTLLESLSGTSSTQPSCLLSRDIK